MNEMDQNDIETQEKEYCCIGFRDLGLIPGEEIRILDGIRLWMPPEKVIIVREYDTWILLDMMFVKSLYYSKMAPRHVRTSVSKGAMLCGDVKLKRMKDGVVLSGPEVGIYDWV